MSRRGQGIDEERDEMRALGFITPREAADAAGVSLNWPYRAMKDGAPTGPGTKGMSKGKTGVPFRLGANAVARYIHKAKWEIWLAKKQEAELARIGANRPGRARRESVGR